MSAMSQKLQKVLAQSNLAGIYHLPHSDCKALKQATLALGYGSHFGLGLFAPAE